MIARFTLSTSHVHDYSQSALKTAHIEFYYIIKENHILVKKGNKQRNTTVHERESNTRHR
jgi:hypothetical protein